MGRKSSAVSKPLTNTESFSKAKFDENGEVTVGSYGAWLAKHPSALDDFEEIMRPAKTKTLVVFLDYDGTLSPIVNDPQQAFMSEKMRSALREVAHEFSAAIVSGRSLEKVKNFVQLDNVTYAGSHGMDILLNDKHSNKDINQNGHKEIDQFQPAMNFLPTMQEILKVMEEKIKVYEGATVEDNKFCISVHYRCLKLEDDVDALKEMVESIMRAYPNFRMSGGKKVIEIRPRIDWDKGRALEYLFQKLGFSDSHDFLPLYIGDDKTDEDAFKAIKDIGQGYSIVVSSTPKETDASYSLRDTDEVMVFLMKLAEWKRGSCTPKIN